MADNLSVQISVNADTKQFEAALNRAGGKAEEVAKVFEQFGPKFAGETTKKVNINLEGKDTATGKIKATDDALEDLDDSIKGTVRAFKALKSAERGSVKSLQQGLSYYKQQLALTNKNSKEYLNLQQRIKGYQGALNRVQGIEKGSIAEKRQMAAELQRLSESYRQGSEQQRRYQRELRKINDEISGAQNPFRGFFSILNRVASVQAGFVAFSAIIQQFTSKINELVGQQKQLEGFELALRNVGLTTSEVNQAFAEATSIANDLGAPLQQVEKTFKRMVPALRAVGVNAEDSSTFIEAVAARSQTLGLNTEQSGRFLEAFAQVLSKGKLQAEELNQQISELDGAFRTQLADALGVTTQELEDLISSGAVTSKVFVKAVSEMENGVEALQNRVKTGNETIQQLQNQIKNLQIENLRDIGKSLEPGIKAFLSIQKIIEEFISTVANSEFGKFLADSFNATVGGIKNFIVAVTEAIKAVGFFLQPVFALLRVFSFLLNPLATLIAAFVTFKGVMMAVAALQGVRVLLGDLAGDMIRARKETIRLNVRLLKLKSIQLLRTFRQWRVGINNFSRDLVKYRGNLVRTIREQKKYQRSTNALKAASARGVAGSLAFGAALTILSLGFNEITSSIAKYREETDGFGESLKNLSDSLKAQEKQVSGLAEGWSNFITVIRNLIGLNAITSIVSNIARSIDQSRLYSITETLNAEFTRLGVNLNTLAGVSQLSDENLKSLRNTSREYLDILEARAKILPKLIAQAKLEGDASNFIQYQKELKFIEAQLPIRRKQLNFLDSEAIARKKAAKATGEQVKSIEELTAAEKERQGREELAIQEIEAAIAKEKDKYETIQEGIENAIKNEIILESVRERIARNNVERIKQEIADIQKRVDLNEEEKRKKLAEYISALQKAEIAAANAAESVAKKVQEEIVRVFEEGTSIAENYADLAQKLSSSISDVRGSIGGAISNTKTLLGQVFDREVSGAGSFTEAKTLEENRLRLLARINDIENKIAIAKLNAAYRLNQLENQRLQIKLGGEATLAERSGDQVTADNLRQQISGLQEVARLQEQAYRADRLGLDLQKRSNDFLLQQQALSTNIKGVDTQLFSQQRNRELAIQEINRELGIQSTSVNDIYRVVNQLGNMADGLQIFDTRALNAQENSVNAQRDAYDDSVERLKVLKRTVDENVESGRLLGQAFMFVDSTMDSIVRKGNNLVKATQGARQELDQIWQGFLNNKAPLGGARWMGGPVQGGQTYRVNDAGLGREAFLSRSGALSMLPAASNINWTAPTSGTIIPAAIVKQMQQNSEHNSRISMATARNMPTASASASNKTSFDSGNLVKQISTAMSAVGGTQRITNNVTIQSQEPVTDASKIMTNVARMRLRNSRRI